MKNRFPLTAAFLAGVLAVAGCSSNTQGDDASPVFLTVSYDELPAAWNVNSGLMLQFDSTELVSVLKSTPSGPTPFLDTRLEDYVVDWQRIDGGTKSPASETFGGNILIPAGGTSSLSNYPYMSASALIRPPLDQLFPFNGGIDRETGRSEIRCRATVTYRGRTLSGQPVRGVGTFGMMFYYSAATGNVVGRVN